MHTNRMILNLRKRGIFRSKKYKFEYEFKIYKRKRERYRPSFGI